MLDLFSFDVPGGGPLRLNLETLFHKYEANIEVHTKGLLEKLTLGSTDITSLSTCSPRSYSTLSVIHFVSGRS